MKLLFLLILLFSNFVLGNSRNSVFEWEEIKGASGYVLEIYQNKKLIKTENTIDSKFSITLAPGRYKWRLKTLDSRKISGPWGDFEDLDIPDQSISYQIEEKGYKKFEIKTSVNLKKIRVFLGKEEILLKRNEIELDIGKHEVEIFGEDEDKTYEPKKITIEVFDKKLEPPNEITFFKKRINWKGEGDFFEIKIKEKTFQTENTFFNFESDLKELIQIRSLSKNKYIPNSDWSTYIFDPEIENIYKPLLKYIEVSSSIQSFSFESIDPLNNERINLKNISSKNSLKFSIQKVLKISGGVDLNLSKINGQIIKYTNKEIGFSYQFSLIENFSFYPKIVFKDFEYLWINSSYISKESSFNSVFGIDLFYGINPRTQFESKFEINKNFKLFEGGFNYRLTQNVHLGFSGGVESFKNEKTESYFDFLKLKLIYDFGR